MVTFVVVVALIACIAGSVVVSRGIRLTEFASNRSRSSFSHVLFTILGSLVGGWMFFGLCAIGFQAGVVGYAIGIGYCLGLVIVGFAIPRIKQAMDTQHCDTMDDLVGAYYGHFAQGCVTCINVLFFLAVLAAQFVAMAAFLKVFVQVEAEWTMYVAVAVVLLYTALAGFKGVLLTDVWQFYILSTSAAVIFVVLSVNTDWRAISNLDKSYFNGMGFGIGFLVGVLVLFPSSLLARSDLWQRIASARDTKSAQRAFFVSAPVLLVFYVLLTTVGIYGRAALGDGVDPETSGFVHFLNVVRGPSGETLSLAANLFLSLLSLGVFAALLSTADTNLNIVAVAVSKLVRRQEWRRFEQETANKIEGDRSAVETQLLTVTRIITLVLGLLAVLVAQAVPDIVNLVVVAGSAVMVFLPTILNALFGRDRRRLPAVVSILFGFAVLLALLPVSPKIAFIPATLMSFVTYGVIWPFSAGSVETPDS